MARNYYVVLFGESNHSRMDDIWVSIFKTEAEAEEAMEIWYENGGGYAELSGPMPIDTPGSFRDGLM